MAGLIEPPGAAIGEQARLLAYRCAWRLDQAGHQGAWRDVSLIKVAVPAMLQRIADRAMQVFGGLGYTRHQPFEHIYRHHRRYRITEGSEEIQIRRVAGALFGFWGAQKASTAPKE